MKKREDYISSKLEEEKIDPLKSKANNTAKKLSLYGEPDKKKSKINQGHKEDKDKKKDLIDDFFLSDSDSEQ
jgi:hypothetical protein